MFIKHENELKSLGYGHSEYLIKPIDLEVLLGKIKQALGINPE